MSHRRVLFVPFLLLAVDACMQTSTPGQLGNGSFVYLCTDAADDLACDRVTQSTTALPSAVAVGANFVVGYDPSSGATGLDPGAPESATPSILADDGSALRFLRAGSATIVVEGNGGIVDFTELAGGDIATFTIDLVASGLDCQGPAPPSPDAGPGDGGAGGGGTGGAGAGGGAGSAGGDAINTAVALSPGGTSDITCDPIDANGTLLAGVVEVTAESSDPAIVSVAPSSLTSAHAIQLCGWAPGTVTITVSGGGKTATFPATVASAQ